MPTLTEILAKMSRELEQNQRAGLASVICDKLNKESRTPAPVAAVCQLIEEAHIAADWLRTYESEEAAAQLMRNIEELSYAHGSVGWCAWVNSLLDDEWQAHK